MSTSPLLSDDTVIVLAQALTGLGHLRVTHALFRGLPAQANPIMLSSQDETVNYMHKLTSINPYLRRLLELSQQGWAEDIFTWFARRYFRQHTKILSDQLLTVLDQHIVRPRTLVIVATHTLIAHQCAAIKEHFAKKNNVRVILIVVVTDDSPQHVWAVGGADRIVVPSAYTRRKLEQYHKTQSDMPPSTYVVMPYMVSPRLTTELSSSLFSRRKEQLLAGGNREVQIAIPISGAAVQLSYFQKLIGALRSLSDRYTFHIVALRSKSTSRFLSRLIGQPRVMLTVSPSHRQTVEAYEQLYEKQIIALEVTKPSEQSFKALVSPRRRGGVILLFSNPVGRQEWDNLRFMTRHHLIPTKEVQEYLWRQAASDSAPDLLILEKAKSWRGLRLPIHSLAGARFIHWCLKHGIFASMERFSGYEDDPELSPDGVARFWRMVEEYLS